MATFQSSNGNASGTRAATTPAVCLGPKAFEVAPATPPVDVAGEELPAVRVDEPDTQYWSPPLDR
ncbi:hypothetical protein GQ53DRAFT_744691 [Thozetella sp. PMI_491]|nr:hypothetical protein GQ53DRAFT_744691 [Thozetella sp. PMI_491]